MARTGLYTGSFDPLTKGHLDVISSAMAICDRIVVAIGVHPSKTPLFDAAERAALIQAECASIATVAGCDVEVATFDGLAVEAARRCGATLMLRGVRDGTDLDYEMQMAGMNAVLAPEVRTVLIPASAASRFITATLVRQIAAMGGDISAFVPASVAAAIHTKIGVKPRP
ncbi:pantetheine-phosphate adenylyltransferase [Lichenihabitans psoromatis]|uniref:pantetheine-phosphate adenylyltransferase n=1 Tax=Lichenihabitans psoromatis TaxID=2528642 RepID=UPI0010384F77|nr:pantetheine-phosphate adenylyltransferase [Lichenihabitans psoromatis]